MTSQDSFLEQGIMASASDIAASSDGIDLHMLLEVSSFEDFPTEDTWDIVP